MTVLPYTVLCSLSCQKTVCKPAQADFIIKATGAFVLNKRFQTSCPPQLGKLLRCDWVDPSHTRPLAVAKNQAGRIGGQPGSLLAALSRIHTPLDDNDLEGPRALQHQRLLLRNPKMWLRQAWGEKNLICKKKITDSCNSLFINPTSDSILVLGW